MTREEFVKQINRLASVFGAQPYAEERRMLIWKEVSTLSNESFTRIVDDLIGNCRQAPLVPEIRECASREREVIWQREKAKHSNESKAAMRQLFRPEDIAMFCKGIRDRLTGDMNDETFTGFTRMLKEFPGPPKCPHCEATGYIWIATEGGDAVYRCICPLGQQKPSGIALVSQEMVQQKFAKGER